MQQSRIRWALLLIVFLGGVAQVMPVWATAVTCTMNDIDDDWTSTKLWNAACTKSGGNDTNGPGADDIVKIPDYARTVTVRADAAAASITFASGANGTTLVISPGVVLTSGNVTIATTSGQKGIDVGAGGTLRINGDLTASGTGGAAGIQLENSASTLVTVTGNIVLTSTNGFAGFNFAGAGKLQAGGSYSGGLLLPGSGTVEFNGTAAQTIPANTYNNLTISNTAAAVSASANLAVSGTLTVNTNATLAPTAGVVISGGGTLTGNGTANVTRVGGDDFNSQYTISNKSLANLAVDYVGTSTQEISARSDYGDVDLKNGSGATMAGNVTIGGTLSLISGTLAVGNRTLTLNGPTIGGAPVNLITTANSSLVFGGASTGVNLPLSVIALSNLTVSNTNGVTLNSSPVAATVNLSGPVNAGTNKLTVSANCPGAITRSGTGFVDGKVKLTFPALSTACVFPVGTVAGTTATYAPITFTAPAGGGTLTGATFGQEHPQIASSDLIATQDANRYWTLWDTGDTITASTYGAVFNFAAGDVDAGATSSNFVLDKYVGGGWSLPTPVSASGTSVTASSIAGPLNSTAGFAVGTVGAQCTVPAGLPAGMSCVCDNFGRSNVNPSTIFGSNFTLSQSSGNSGWPKIATPGFLQLTDNSANMSTSATLPGTFQAAGNLITVEFKHYSYNGSGADGIALTLSDSAITPVPGAFGGSLGYAQKNTPSIIPGFAGGWVGIALDEFGNFSSPTEGRILGPGALADSVAVRGSGTGQTGYPYIGGTGTLAPSIDNAAATRAPGYSYRITVDARCYQANPAGVGCNNAALAKKTTVAVDRDTGGGYTSLFPAIDAFAANSSQANVPSSWKLSFTGSTGGAANIHELGALKVCAQTITPPAGYLIQVDNFTPSSCSVPGGTPTSPVVTVTARDPNGNTITNYTNTVNLSATLAGGAASSATWRKVGAGANLVGNQYTFVPLDNGTAQFYLTDTSAQTVFVTATENGGAISGTGASPVVFSGGGSFSITNTDTLAAGAGGGVVAGRNHLFQIQRLNCSGTATTDTTYGGSKALDGWYNPAASDHPVGALAPQLCAASPNGTGSCLPSTGTCTALSPSEPTISASSNLMPAITFTKGVANVCLATTDVGKYTFGIRDDTGTTPIRGTSSGMLTVRPFAVAVSAIKSGATDNPATDANTNPAAPFNVTTPQLAPQFISAGTNFEATLGGYLWNSVADANGDGLPSAAAGLTQLKAAGIAPSYADTVVLSAGTPFTPAVGTLGSMNGTTTIVGGQAHPLSLSYSDVGSFTLNALPSTAYLNSSGVDLTSRAMIYANPASNLPSKWVGRFVPHHFTASNDAILPRSDFSCSPASIFTYMGEPMGAKFRLTAQNAANVTTVNYIGAFAKLPLTPSSSFAFGAVDSTGPGTTLTARLDTSAAATGAWVAGVANVVAPVALSRSTTAPLEDGPFVSFKLGIKPVDSDNVGLLSTALNLDTNQNGSSDTYLIGAATQVRFGRLTMSNAYGSEFLKLPISIGAQYWNGANGFVTNTDDNCTPIPTGSITMSGFRDNLKACETIVPATAALFNGAQKMVLSAPGAGNNGSVDLKLNLGATASGNVCTTVGAGPGAVSTVASPSLSYLQGKWTGSTYTVDPTAKATFGVYKSGPVIYIREIH
jgi:MSHA biogenesis protein MshQ